MISFLKNFVKRLAKKILPDWILIRITHAGFRRYFKNTGWMFVGKVMTMIVGFIMGIYVARYLGPSEYGLLSYAISFTALFSFLVNLGIDSVISRNLVHHPEERDVLLGSSFVLKFIGACVAFVAIIAALFIIHSDTLTSALILIIAGASFFQPFYIISNYFQSQVQSKYPVILSVVAVLFLSSLKIVFLLSRASLIYFASIYLIEGIVYAVGYVYVYKKSKLHIRLWKFNWPVAKNILVDSWPLLFSSVFAVIYYRIDQVMLKYMIGNSVVGMYDVAVRLSEVWYFIPSLLVASLFPALINAKKTDAVLYEKRLRDFYSLVIYMSVVIFLPLSLLAPFLIGLLYGQAFMGAAAILQVYVWSGIAIAVGVVLGQYLIIENFTKISLFVSLTGAVVNILLNLFLIPRWGGVGAAYATLISYTLMPIVIVLFKKTRGHLRVIGEAFLPQSIFK